MKKIVPAAAKTRKPPANLCRKNCKKKPTKGGKSTRSTESTGSTGSAGSTGVILGYWDPAMDSPYTRRLLTDKIGKICKNFVNPRWAKSVYEQLEDEYLFTDKSLSKNKLYSILVAAQRLPANTPEKDIVARDQDGVPMGKAYGFALLRPHASSIEVKLVCSNRGGIGKKMMDLVETIAAANKKPTITLYAIQEAVSFYKRIGFHVVEHKEHGDTMDKKVEKNTTVSKSVIDKLKVTKKRQAKRTPSTHNSKPITTKKKRSTPTRRSPRTKRVTPKRRSPRIKARL